MQACAKAGCGEPGDAAGNPLNNTRPFEDKVVGDEGVALLAQLLSVPKVVRLKPDMTSLFCVTRVHSSRDCRPVRIVFLATCGTFFFCMTLCSRRMTPS
jgi:hypothetical protein